MIRKRDLRKASAEEKKDAIAEILTENPNATRAEITELTGIPDSTVFHHLQKLKGLKAEEISHLPFATEAELEDWVKKHSFDVFGEEIIFDASSKRLPGEMGNSIECDLFGKDANGRAIIVEVKLQCDFYSVRTAIGQVLHYLYAEIYRVCNASARETPFEPTNEALLQAFSEQYRLFIVTPLSSPAADHICQLLQAHGLQIEHRCVEGLIRK